MSRPGNVILLVHPPSLNPRDFVERLVGSVDDWDDLEDKVEWNIENKYYSAEVSLRLYELDHDDAIRGDNVDVLIYLFDSIPKTIPAALVRELVDRPKDIALAIKVSRSAEANQPSPKGISDTDVDTEELFEEVGLEFIDEDAPPQDDDERPISPMETIRQTLMTHMWPDMLRKPLNRRDNPQLPDDSDVDNSDNDDEALNAGGPSTFPTVFITTSAERAQHGAEEFPGLDELKAQLQLDNLDRFDNSRGLARLEMMEDLMYGDLDEDLAGGPGPEEYARLDDWLDEDDEGDDLGFAPLDGGEGDDLADGAGPDAQSTSEEHNVVDDRRPRQPEFQPTIDGLDGDGDDGFEDDFDDFAAFQSAPQERPRGTVGSLSLDPTPLLLHLQSVRAELAEVGDEDERRVRAGREVARVMRDLGLGDDLDDDDDDDGMRGLSLALAGTPKVAP